MTISTTGQKISGNASSLNGATEPMRLNHLVERYREAISNLADAKTYFDEAKQALEDAREAELLDSCWDRMSKCYLLPGGLSISESKPRQTYSAKSYSNKLQEMMQAERDEGIATPTISTSWRYKLDD